MNGVTKKLYLEGLKHIDRTKSDLFLKFVECASVDKGKLQVLADVIRILKMIKLSPEKLENFSEKKLMPFVYDKNIFDERQKKEIVKLKYLLIKQLSLSGKAFVISNSLDTKTSFDFFNDYISPNKQIKEKLIKERFEAKIKEEELINENYEKYGYPYVEITPASFEDLAKYGELKFFSLNSKNNLSNLFAVVRRININTNEIKKWLVETKEICEVIEQGHTQIDLLSADKEKVENFRKAFQIFLSLNLNEQYVDFKDIPAFTIILKNQLVKNEMDMKEISQISSRCIKKIECFNEKPKYEFDNFERLTFPKRIFLEGFENLTQKDLEVIDKILKEQKSAQQLSMNFKNKKEKYFE